MIGVNKEKCDNVWKDTSSKSMKDSILPQNFMKTNLQMQSSYPSQYISPSGQAASKFNKILAPPKLIIGNHKLEDRLDDLNLNNHFKNHKMSKQEYNNDSFLFKKPLPITTSRKLAIDRVCDETTLKEKKNKVENFPKQSTEDISENETEMKTEISELKKKLRSLVVKKDKDKSKKYSICKFFLQMIWFLLCLSPIIVIMVMFVISADFSNEICNPLFKFDKIPEDLKSHIHGQEAAITYLTEYFVEKNNKSGFDVLAFIGGIGVGKSYSSEIIKNNLKDDFNLLEYFPPLYKKVNEAYKSLSLCKCNLIRLDNLKTYDILDTVQFIVELKKEATDGYCTLILAIFNTEETDFNLKKIIDLDKSVAEIGEKFQKSNMQPVFIKFESLSEEVLIKCIEDAANYANVELSSEALERVKQDLILSESGCKGAYSKVQIVGKPIKQDL